MNVSKSPRHTSCSTSPDKIDSTEKDSISIPPSIPPPPPSLIKAQLSSSRSVASNIDEGFALLDVSICNQSQFCFTLKTLRLTVGRGPLATPEAYLFIRKVRVWSELKISAFLFSCRKIAEQRFGNAIALSYLRTSYFQLF